MTFTVQVRQFEAPLAVEMGQTILEAALGLGLPYPHGCRAGNCGACKSELIAGEVEMSPHSEFALSAAERDQGLILACRAVPWSDCAVAFLDAEAVVVHPLRHLQARVAAVEAATHDIRRVTAEILSGGPFTFSAGQYASLTFPGLPARDYSMANAPAPGAAGDETLEFHIRLNPGGAVSPYVADRLKPGDALGIVGPYGTAYLREGHGGPILALAGGSGLAPIRSIVETALARGMGQPIRLYLGMRAERDVYEEARLRALAARHPNLSLEVVLSAPEGPTGRRTGFLADALRADRLALDGAKAYLAGPPVMVETATATLEDLGLRRQDIHADAFYTEAEKASLEARGAA